MKSCMNMDKKEGILIAVFGVSGLHLDSSAEYVPTLFCV